MSKSIVVFGMAHAGKSTCIGYMYNRTKEKEPNYDFEKYINNLKLELSEYDSSRDYGYLVDEFNEERIKTRSKSGTSKKIHLKPIELGEARITVIDTPGSEHKSKQRQKGMYYGDIGVFCIEITQIVSEEFFTKKDLFTTFMATLILWSKFKRKTIIALTKMDLCDFDEQVYMKACEIIAQLCEMVNIAAIVPISVNVKERKAHNIYDKSVKMEWYNGDTLSDILVRELKDLDKTENNLPLLFYVDRSYLKSKQYTGQSWRIKILQGEIREDQEIIISPVLVNGKVETITAKVKSIRADLEKTGDNIIKISSASEGSFVGIDLYEIHVANRRVNKTNIKTLGTSCGFTPNLSYKMSDTFVFKTSFIELEKLNVKRQMDILWFGRAITFQIIERKSVMNGIEVTGKLMNKYISMPISNDGSFIIKDLIIRYDHNRNSDPFIEAELIDIGG